MNDNDHGKQPSMAVEVLSALIASGAGYAMAGAPGALVGSGAQPILAGNLVRVQQELGQLRYRSAEQVVEEAACWLGVGPESLVDAALRDEYSAQLLGQAIQAAANTVNKQKICGLAQALANRLRDDDAHPEEEQIVIAALAEVEAPHIKVLTQLGPERGRSRTSNTGLRNRTAPSRGQTPAVLAGSCNMGVPAVRAVLSVLERAGMAAPDETAETVRIDRLIMETHAEVNKLGDLISKPPRDGKIPSNKRPKALQRPGSPARPGWVITPFGTLCLAYLEGEETDISATKAFEHGDERLAGSPTTPTFDE